MNRYFFDLVGHKRSQYDFRGKELDSPQAAHQMAELMAIDLEVTDEGNWCGWAVSVRNALGQHFCSIPVQESRMAAA
jgi:hypothetical protein